MRSYELYLDESGKFIHEEKAISPSLIGGILVKKGDLLVEQAQKIMKEAVEKVAGKYVHINDISKEDPILAGMVAFKIMQAIKDIPAYFVIFENNELLDFKDDKILYLNIVTEGIVNLLEKLSLERADEIELNVVAAVRRDLEVEDDKAIIELEEYSQRIKERIYMKIAEKNIFLSRNCKIHFSLSSARKNPKLMLADVVCNTRLTRNSQKFSEDQKLVLEKNFQNSRYIFNVFRTNIQKKLSEYLLQNNIVDAIFLMNEVDNLKDKEELIRLIVNNINTISTTNLRIQLELLSLKIRSMIDVQRNLLLCEKFLLSLQKDIIGKIKVKDFIIYKLKLDVSLYLLTIYTHLGNNIKSKEQIDISTQELGQISGSWEFFEYYYILKIREAIYYNTCFRHDKTVEVLTEAIEKYEQVLHAMEGIKEFESMKSDTLAKAVGTRLQAYTNLITPNLDEETKKTYYQNGVKDSEYAISQFVSQTDKRRQYQYRCMLEISCGYLDNALKYLMKVVGLNELNFPKFMEQLANISDFSRNFIMVNYLEVMQYAIHHDQIDIAKKMYQAFEENKTIYQEYSLRSLEDNALFTNTIQNIAIHPFEIIYWNIAKYLKNSNKELASSYYDKAIEICHEINEPVLYILEIAIEADRLTISKNILQDKELLITKYKTILQKKEFSEIHAFLNQLKDEFEYIEISNDVAEIKSACHIISGEIKI